jgi:hypothetical protein
MLSLLPLLEMCCGEALQVRIRSMPQPSRRTIANKPRRPATSIIAWLSW